MIPDINLFKEKHDKILDKVFYPSELSSIKSKRRKLEDKINKSNDKKLCFTYIKFEKTLWKAILNRTRNPKIHRVFAEIVINLHKIALKYHKEYLPLWLSYIRFCLEANFSHLITNAISQMLSIHTDECLWLLASKWEVEEHDNIHIALAHLQRALTHHPYSQPIFCEIFRLELEISNTSLNFTREESNTFNNIKTRFPSDKDLYINLLKISLSYQHCTNLKNNIVAYMMQNFSKDEEIIELLAHLELDGHHFSDKNEYSFISNNATLCRFQNFLKKYQRAVHLLQTETMWTRYLKALIELQDDMKYKDFHVQRTFMDACLKAHQAKLLSEDIYVKWLALLNDDPNLLQILKEATVIKPNCLRLWIAMIRHYISISPDMNTADQQIELVFKEALNICEDNKINIWRLKILYNQMNLNSDVSKMESVYKDAMQSSPQDYRYLKPHYLEWVFLFKSNRIGYKEYERLAREEPWCFELHQKMIEIEAISAVPNENILRLVEKLAIEQFGENFWREYVNKEKNNCSTDARWRIHIFTKYYVK